MIDIDTVLRNHAAVTRLALDGPVPPPPTEPAIRPRRWMRGPVLAVAFALALAVVLVIPTLFGARLEIDPAGIPTGFEEQRLLVVDRDPLLTAPGALVLKIEGRPNEFEIGRPAPDQDFPGAQPDVDLDCVFQAPSGGGGCGDANAAEPRLDMSVGPAEVWITWSNVPDTASLVVIDAGEQRFWQRPILGVSILRLDSWKLDLDERRWWERVLGLTADTVTLKALDASGDVVAEIPPDALVSPIQQGLDSEW